MKITRFVLLMILLVLSLSACSSSNKPKDVSQDFWDEAIQITLYVDKRINENKGGDWNLINGLGASSEEFSEGERKISRDLYNFALASDEYYLASYLDGLQSEEGLYEEDYKQTYDEAYSKLKELFGSSTLEKTELDEISMEGIIAKYKEVKVAENQAIKKADAATKRQEDEDLAWAKSRNPTIGMTKEQVEVSLWGKPQKVNRTVTQYSITEQWVYPNYKYLYFEDGILTSFQD